MASEKLGVETNPPPAPGLGPELVMASRATTSLLVQQHTLIHKVRVDGALGFRGGQGGMP